MDVSKIDLFADVNVVVPVNEKLLKNLDLQKMVSENEDRILF